MYTYIYIYQCPKRGVKEERILAEWKYVFTKFRFEPATCLTRTAHLHLQASYATNANVNNNKEKEKKKPKYILSAKRILNG